LTSVEAVKVTGIQGELSSYVQLSNSEGADPQIKSTAIGIAVLAFYCLDFALNA
jgi:hypothetical protein